MASACDKSKGPASTGIRDVAARAGVSVGTVSNVLNRPDRVAKNTRERVTAVMDELGFVPSRAAGQLRSRRSGLIGVIVPDVGNPFWASVLHGVERVLDAHHMAMLLISSRQDPVRQLSALQVLQSRGVDGLIIAPISDDFGDLEAFRSSRYGVVTLGINGAPADLPSVNTDSFIGGEMAMSYLLAAGHTRIGLINGPEFVSWCSMRRDGAVTALKKKGISRDDTLVEVTVADLTVDEGDSAAASLLNETDVTAILCVNDMLALGAIRHINERGLRIPEEFSIIGYDDADFAALLSPPLTTIYQPSQKMGETAAKLLFKHGSDSGPIHIDFEPELIERKSVARPTRTSHIRELVDKNMF